MWKSPFASVRLAPGLQIGRRQGGRRLIVYINPPPFDLALKSRENFARYTSRARLSRNAMQLRELILHFLQSVRRHRFESRRLQLRLRESPGAVAHLFLIAIFGSIAIFNYRYFDSVCISITFNSCEYGRNKKYNPKLKSKQHQTENKKHLMND